MHRKSRRFLVLGIVLLCMGGVLFAPAVVGAASPSTTDDIDPASQEEQIRALQNLPPDVYMRGRIERLEPSTRADQGLIGYVRVLDGSEEGSVVPTEINDSALANKGRTPRVGEAVVIVKSAKFGGEFAYYIADTYRLRPLLAIALLFAAIAVFFGKKRGLTSIIGLATTVVIMVWGIIPRIVAGANPFQTILVGGVGIMLVSFYLGHGFNRRTTVALVSAFLTFGISAGLATLFVSWSKLFGMGSEEAFFLQVGALAQIDLRGLLLGGIILGVLGILDDITTAQAAVVEELKSANPALGFRELYRRGISVGREHIASLINTLFLAYAGVALPLFLLFATGGDQPLWFVVNSEQIAEEIIRTLVGSVGLILAVPIATALAAAYFGRHEVSDVVV